MKTNVKQLKTEILFAETYSELSFHVSSYGSDVLWVVDENTSKMVRPLPEPNIVLPSGESCKSWENVSEILKTAARNRLTRDSRFIGFGGGAISDVTAFAASVYMRGAKLVLIPTTMLSMVDAALGGKTAIDFAGGKNLLGSFYPADEVLICTETLKTLARDEYIDGLSEAIKNALLSKDDELLNLLVNEHEKIMQRDPVVLKQVIMKSLKIKFDYVDGDIDDRLGIRAALNFGHTFAHALEVHTNFLAIPHGQAVAWGIARALEAGLEMGITDPSFAETALSVFSLYGFNTSYRVRREQWMEFYDGFFTDKKRKKGKIMFVLLKNRGDYVLSEIDPQLIRLLVIKQAKIEA